MRFLKVIMKLMSLFVLIVATQAGIYGQPVLKYSGGIPVPNDPSNSKVGFRNAVDSQGNVYIIGGDPGAHPLHAEGFITKLRPDGNAPLYFTQFDTLSPTGIAIDAEGNPLVVGWGHRVSVTGGGLAACPKILSDLDRNIFIARLAATGEVASLSCLGGSDTDTAQGIALDHEGNIYITGSTDSVDFPVTAGAMNTTPQGAFVAKLNANATQLLWATYLGNGGVQQGKALAPGPDGTVYVLGSTAGSLNLATPGVAQPLPGHGTVIETRDGGKTWMDRSRGLPGEPPTGLAVDSTNPRVHYAINSLGVYRTSDDGDSWVRVGDPPVPDAQIRFELRADPFRPTTVYALANSQMRCGVFKTIDGGETWKGPLGGPANCYAWAFAIDPKDSSVLYLAGHRGLEKSTDGGETWQSLSDVSATQIAIDWNNPAKLMIISGYRLFGSEDGGVTWAPLTMPEPWPRSIAIAPSSSSIIYVRTDGGLYRSDDGGHVWSRYATDTWRYYGGRILVDPNDPNIVYSIRGLASLNDTWEPVLRADRAGGWKPGTSGLAAWGASELFIDPGDSSRWLMSTVTGYDAFVAHISADGKALLYLTYFGGMNDDYPASIALDSVGNVYLAGSTLSDTLPVTPGAAQPSFGGGGATTTYNDLVSRPGSLVTYGGDGFVAKLNADGSRFEYGTYLGGSDVDAIRDLAVDAAGFAYVTGEAHSKNFPQTPGAFPLDTDPLKCCADGFLTILDQKGRSFIYSSLFLQHPIRYPRGGSLYGSGIALGPGNSVYLTGKQHPLFTLQTPGAHADGPWLAVLEIPTTPEDSPVRRLHRPHPLRRTRAMK